MTINVPAMFQKTMKVQQEHQVLEESDDEDHYDARSLAVGEQEEIQDDLDGDTDEEFVWDPEIISDIEEDDIDDTFNDDNFNSDLFGEDDHESQDPCNAGSYLNSF